jgi:hypothetical protein
MHDGDGDDLAHHSDPAKLDELSHILAASLIVEDRNTRRGLRHVAAPRE